ncbi:MAG TPA: hypothetical protein VMB52_02775 [Verrucomicrobiae bacterium]|nr:hypothetical protein [Verrucomicrobiae bacterium]
MAYSPLALLSIIFSIKKSRRLLSLVLTFFLPPLLITAAIFCVNTALLYSCRYPVASFDDRRPANNTFCSIKDFPLDNGLPEMFGVDILQHQPDPMVLDWSIANRPPLQIAATLPIEDLDSNATPSRISTYYNLFSIFLQLLWVGAAWALFQRLKIRRRYQIVLFIGFCATGFFYLNSVFVWPKLLAGALVLAGMTPFIGAKLNKNLFRYLPVAATLISLGLMSHGGVVFTVIPFVCFMLYKLWQNKERDYRQVGIAAVIALAILIPWQVYTASIPNASYLIKYQFANVTDASQAAKHGTVKTILNAYESITFGQWVSYKLQNVRTLFDGTGDQGFMYICPIDHVVASRDDCVKQRDLTFFSTLFSLESFAVGFLFLIYQAFRRRLDSFDKESLLLIAVSLVLWVLLLFAPGSTVVHQGSYANNILLFILVGRAILRSAPRFLIFVVVAQFIIFYAAWIHPFPYFSYLK